MVLGAIKAFARDHTILFVSFSMGFAGLGLLMSQKGESVSPYPKTLDPGRNISILETIGKKQRESSK
eukprot:CAMPEP_0114486788 /NCGR_PEP_ID=MMETSP0109-20121206/408_1 /TAXON_ID=29199 /ORGANISM="Chlorarachnion reptans, Strain CCCM449" /LENGTH=66 /DNA_ID=CAMNT_0001662987 /DNA_START=43 /DNA_END=243 /DNA_ORIENTATION=-